MRNDRDGRRSEKTSVWEENDRKTGNGAAGGDGEREGEEEVMDDDCGVSPIVV